MKLTEKHKPLLMISSKEKYNLLNCYYKISKKGNEICIQYWFTWDYSKALLISKLMLYGKDHNFDIEPIFVYLKKNKVTKVIFDAGHYAKGTIKNPELKDNRPIIKVIAGSHGYMKYRKIFRNHFEKEYKISPLTKEKENFLENKVKEMGKKLAPMYKVSIKPIIKNPWNFFPIPKKHILLYLSALVKADKDARLFCELK